jgi:hypothetical protein
LGRYFLSPSGVVDPHGFRIHDFRRAFLAVLAGPVDYEAVKLFLRDLSSAYV